MGNAPGLIDFYDKGTKVQLTMYGRLLRQFIDYAKSHPRHHTHSHVRPETCIIRFPDSCDSEDMGRYHRTDALMGAWRVRRDSKNNNAPVLIPGSGYEFENLIPTRPVNRVWFNILRAMTHDTVGVDLCGHQTFFFPLNNLLVYDHRVTLEHLESVGLIFLTGVYVSPETLEAVSTRVRDGATCIGLPHLLPQKVRAGFTSEEVETPDRKGRWIVTRDFLGPLSQSAMLAARGPSDEIRYVFDNPDRKEVTTVVFKRVGNNRDHAKPIVSVAKYTPRAGSTQPSE